MDGGYVTSHLVMHFTHVKNLSGILATGRLQADSLVDRSSVLQVEAADPAVKSRRKVRRVRLPPFGQVADYVPFYFAPRSPMLLTLAKGRTEAVLIRFLAVFRVTGFHAALRGQPEDVMITDHVMYRHMQRRRRLPIHIPEQVRTRTVCGQCVEDQVASADGKLHRLMHHLRKAHAASHPSIEFRLDVRVGEVEKAEASRSRPGLWWHGHRRPKCERTGRSQRFEEVSPI